jgi:hypothetical protein
MFFLPLHIDFIASTPSKERKRDTSRAETQDVAPIASASLVFAFSFGLMAAQSYDRSFACVAGLGWVYFFGAFFHEFMKKGTAERSLGRGCTVPLSCCRLNSYRVTLPQ